MTAWTPAPTRNLRGRPQDAEGRALADRMEVATVEAAEQANQPKFAGPGAVRPGGAAPAAAGPHRTRPPAEAAEEGQISPEQAETQFDRWMGLNVEGPLAGYERAAQQERQEQEQADLAAPTRATRVDAATTPSRGQLAYEAGEAGRRQAIEIGERTRAPEYIADLGRVANSMATGAVLRLLPRHLRRGELPQGGPQRQRTGGRRRRPPAVAHRRPATEREVNVPEPPPYGRRPPGSDGRRKVSGPMLAAPPNEQPLPGRERSTWRARASPAWRAACTRQSLGRLADPAYGRGALVRSQTWSATHGHGVEGDEGQPER